MIRTVCAALGTIAVLVAGDALAADVGNAGGAPVVLDVTETTVVAQHFDPRTPSNQAAPGVVTVEDSGWGEWINRTDAALRWQHWTAGLRLDSSVYWRRPADDALYRRDYPAYATIVRADDPSRFRDAVYPAKLWATYATRTVEVTAGDSYVQFGRGLTLSMRKVDELGIDTTVRGGKVQVNADPFAVTAIAGLANPTRVDEATGRALFVTSDPRQPVFGSDRVVGLDLQAGRGLPVTLSTHFVRFTRCAPFALQPGGTVGDSLATSPEADTFATGTCNAQDTDVWLASLNPTPRGLRARDITMAGQSLEIPSFGGHGKLYLEAAVQQRQEPVAAGVGTLGGGAPPDGNALYAALSFDAGPTATTLELKSNRNFTTVAASVAQQAPELSIVGYSFLPPAESFTMLDAEGVGDFNACVEGGRLREDVNVSRSLLVYGQGVFAYSQTEQPNGSCDALGRTITSTGIAPASVEDVVADGIGGVEYTFDDARSHVYVSGGARDDTRRDDVVQYREHHLEYSFAKYLGGPWSIEVQGRHRHRKEQDFNLGSDDRTPAWWYEGENTVALRMAPKWAVTQGFEYTTLTGQPLLYFNGSVLYRIPGGSSVRLFVGEQRAAFRCASGICRFFPAFEGARLELTARF
ncbi:MAG TPA: DUF6029 family protein [Polyangiaceae bacterium]